MNHIHSVAAVALLATVFTTHIARADLWGDGADWVRNETRVIEQAHEDVATFGQEGRRRDEKAEKEAADRAAADRAQKEQQRVDKLTSLKLQMQETVDHRADLADTLAKVGAAAEAQKNLVTMVATVQSKALSARNKIAMGGKVSHASKSNLKAAVSLIETMFEKINQAPDDKSKYAEYKTGISYLSDLAKQDSMSTEQYILLIAQQQVAIGKDIGEIVEVVTMQYTILRDLVASTQVKIGALDQEIKTQADQLNVLDPKPQLNATESASVGTPVVARSRAEREARRNLKSIRIVITTDPRTGLAEYKTVIAPDDK